MELQNQKKLVSHIFRLLKVNEIVIPIGRTNKGNLGLKFQANTEGFEIYLDAVPLSTKDMLADDNNIELKKMLEKYLFENRESVARMAFPTLTAVEEGEITREEGLAKLAPKKQRGRPKGSKSKVN